MKNRYLFILLSVCLFFSCGEDRTASEMMDRAEILLEANPDSTYTLLNKMETPDKLNNRQFARWCMLYCRAADKLSEDMLYTEQLDRALNWYKSHGTAEQQAWMGLYWGRSYVEDKLFVPATKAYSDALDLAKEKHLYNVAGYICSYMADLYTYTDQRTEERRKFEEAANFFKKTSNVRSYAFALRDVARTWAFDDSMSIALDLMLKADSIIMGMNDSVGMLSIANGLGNIYEMLGEIDIAKNFFLKRLSYDTTDMAPTYLALSHLYYNNDLLDSARYYLEKADIPTSNSFTFSDRLYAGYLIEKEAGNLSKALQYMEQCYEAKDSLYDEKKQVDIIDAEKRHNLVTFVKKNRRLQIQIYTVFSIAVFVCLIICLFYQVRDRRRLNKINKQQMLLDENEHQLLELKNEISRKEAEWKINGYGDVERKEAELIRNRMIKIQQEVIVLRCDKLQYSSLFKKIKTQCQKGGLKETKDLWEEEKASFIRLIDISAPNIATFMHDNPFNLTNGEMEICYLSFLGLGLKEESILLDINADSVNKRRLRARQKLNLVNTKISLKEFLVNQIP